MPRGRPANKEKLAAKQAAEKAEAEKRASMTQEELESEAEQLQAEKEALAAKHPNIAVAKRMMAREEKAAKKSEKGELGKKRFEAYREKVKNMSEEARNAHLSDIKEKGSSKRKRIQGDLIFPVKSIKKNLRGFFGLKRTYKGKQDDRIKITLDSAIFTTAVIEYLTAEVLELSGECSKQMKKSRIVPRHIMSAVRMDDELNRLFPKTLTIATAGVLPKPMPSFLLKSNIPRSQWTAGPNDIFRETAISAPTARKSEVSTKGEVNNNK